MILSNATIKYGSLIAVVLIAYFLLIDAIGLGDQLYLSFFNAVIMFTGTFLVVREVYKDDGQEFKYLDGFLTGVASGIIATVIFTIFMAIYLFEVRPELSETIADQVTVAGGNVEVSALIFVALSGFTTAIISSLVVIPIYKKSWNT